MREEGVVRKMRAPLKKQSSLPKVTVAMSRQGLTLTIVRQWPRESTAFASNSAYVQSMRAPQIIRVRGS